MIRHFKSSTIIWSTAILSWLLLCSFPVFQYFLQLLLKDMAHVCLLISGQSLAQSYLKEFTTLLRTFDALPPTSSTDSLVSPLMLWELAFQSHLIASSLGYHKVNI